MRVVCEGAGPPRRGPLPLGRPPEGEDPRQHRQRDRVGPETAAVPLPFFLLEVCIKLKNVSKILQAQTAVVGRPERPEARRAPHPDAGRAGPRHLRRLGAVRAFLSLHSTMAKKKKSARGT